MTREPTVTILDCDFGRGEIEAEILSGAGYHCRLEKARTEDDVIRAARDAEGLLTQYAPVTAAVLDAAPTVRAVVRYGVGLDVVDLHAAHHRGVAVAGVPGYCVEEVADHTLALILAATRSVVSAASTVRRGHWPRPASLPLVTTLSSLTVGIVGFGQIGRAVASRVAAFTPRVVAHDPQVPDPDIRAAGGEPLDLDELFRTSHVVTLHLPATKETGHLVDRRRLALMPPGSVLINTSRAALVDEAALLHALRSRHLAAAALDVTETDGRHSELADMNQVIITPHMAYYSPQALQQLRERAATTVVQLLKGDPS